MKYKEEPFVYLFSGYISGKKHTDKMIALEFLMINIPSYFYESGVNIPFL